MNKSRLPRNCRQVDDYYNPDQWIECLEASYLEVSSFFRTNKNLFKNIPYSTSDMLARKYEDLRCFQALCVKDSEYDFAKSVISMPFYSESKLFSSLLCKNTFFTNLDSLNEIKVNFFDNIKHIFTLLFSFKFIKINQDVKNIIAGISSTEIPTSQNSLNAFWLTEDDILSTSETVYYFPTIKKASYDNAICINNVSLCSQISFVERIRILLSKCSYTFLCLFCFKIEKSFFLKNFFLIQLWQKFHKEKKIKNYISNISELWPCPVHVEVLNGLGVNTILWSYSYYGARASSVKKFSGQCLNLSFACFTNIFLWDQKLIDLFKSCEINLTEKKARKYYISGPIINGSIKHLYYSQECALAALKLESIKNKTIVSVFDLPAWKSEIRRDHGIGLFTTLKIQDSFYKEIYKLINSNSDLVILVKSKRKSTNSMMPFWFTKLAELENHGNLFFLEESISPVLLVNASNIVITTPFTSPSKIAEYIGIKNFYMDPSETFKFISISENQILKEIPKLDLKRTGHPKLPLTYMESNFVKVLKNII